MPINTITYPEKNKLHPLKFALWIGIASLVMMFGAFTSAYMVRQAAGNWLEFKLPVQFLWSTVVIVLSSITLHFSYRSFKNGNGKLYKQLLVLTFLLGILFVVSQYLGWQDMQKIGVDFNGNPSGSFVYLISSVHVLHVLGGLTALLVAIYYAFSLRYYVTPKRLLRFEIVCQYWHFVDVLWIYLFIFFLLQR